MSNLINTLSGLSADARAYIFGLLSPRWPTSVREAGLWAGITVGTIGLSAYLYIRMFCDWLWDDLILIRGILNFTRRINASLDALYDPANQLEKQAKEIPNKPFLLYDDQKITFSQTNSRANQIAHALSKLGITREQRIAILMKNKPEIILTYYACLKSAIPISFLNTNLRTKALMHCVRDGSTKNLIVDDDPELLAAVDEIADELKADGIRVFVYGKTEKYDDITQTIGECSTEQYDVSVRKDLTTRDVALFIFTSGTTGLPKAAKITYARLGRSSAFFCAFGMNSDDVAYSPLPLYHSAALLIFCGSSLLMGSSFAFAKKFSVRNFWEDCDKHGATVIQYIGETCRYLLTKSPSESDRKHKVKMALGNGLRRDIWKEFQTRFGIERIGEFYAATEGNVFIGNFRNKFGSVGRRSPLSDLSDKIPSPLFLLYDTENDEILRDEKGLCKIAPPGTPGLVVAKIDDKGRFDGYANAKQTSTKIIVDVKQQGDKFFNTGDLMVMKKDYYVYFVDRIGDTFRWKGENVSTQEVANLIGELDTIQDCSIYGVTIPGNDGRCGMAAIVLKSGVKPSPDILKSIHTHCEQSLPSYARPVFVRFMAELHLTGTFKHQKFKLQKEGYDCRTLPDVYVSDVKNGTYISLSPQIHDDIISGARKV